MKKMFFISGTREQMMEFVWEYIVGRMDCEVMHRVDLYDSCGMYIKVDDGNPRKWFIQACKAYDIKIRWYQPEGEVA